MPNRHLKVAADFAANRVEPRVNSRPYAQLEHIGIEGFFVFLYA